MKTIVGILMLVLTVSACSSKQEERTPEVVSQAVAAVQPASLSADRISVEIIHPNGEAVTDLYSLESKEFQVRTSRPLKDDEYFWVGTSGPFTAYLKSYPEHKPLSYSRVLEKVEVTGGQWTGPASFCVVVMESTKNSKHVAETCARVRVLPVPEEDSVTVRQGDTLYELSDIYLNDPEKWNEVVRKNLFLREPGRVFKRSGKVIVIIKPGEKLNGLARLGVRVSR